MEPQELVKTYDICLATSYNPATGRWEPDGRLMIRNAYRVKKDNAFDEIKAHKSEIIDILTAEENTRKAAFEDRQRRIDSIEGLKEIVAAKEADRKWWRAFNRAMDDENNDGVNIPVAPKYDFEAAYKKYPKAAAYLKAQGLADSSNYDLSAIGRKAVEGILYGDWKEAIETMNAERSANADKHAWD